MLSMTVAQGKKSDQMQVETEVGARSCTMLKAW